MNSPQEGLDNDDAGRAYGGTVKETMQIQAADGTGMQKLTMEQAVVISGYTGILICPFHVLHGEIEKRMGRPVWTHELGNEGLMEVEIKPKFKADFIAMAPLDSETATKEADNADSSSD